MTTLIRRLPPRPKHRGINAGARDWRWAKKLRLEQVMAAWYQYAWEQGAKERERKLFEEICARDLHRNKFDERSKR